MAVDIKVAPDEKLELVQTYITDTNSNSDYFNISELPDTFSGGKNAFLLAGSDKLVANTEIKIQIRDSEGKVCYIEYSNGSPEYYEGNSKVVAVYVYPNTTAFGPATITILGQLKDVPQEWNGLYSVKWTKQININPALANTTRVRFYKRPQVSITEIIEPLYTIVSGSKTPSLIQGSFASIKVNQLETFAGDVKRIKVYRTAQGDISDYDLIQDILVESKNLLTTYTLSGSVVGDGGVFTNDSLSKLWLTGSLYGVLNSTYINDGLQLTGSGALTYSSSLNLLSSNTYELQLDSFFTGSTANKLGIYVSYPTQSILGQPYTSTTPIATLNGITPTKNFGTQTFPFNVPFDYPTASLYLSQDSGTTQWHVGNISLNVSQDTAFSPNEISFITSMPTVLTNETFNFKFEFYDVNNNFVPVAVTQSAVFVGGTNFNTLQSGSLYASASISASLAALSQSVSGTISLTSQSVSSSIAATSSSLSSSISKSASDTSASAANFIILVSGSLNDSIDLVSGSVVVLSSSVSTSLSSLSASLSSSVFGQASQSLYQVYSASAFLDKFIYTDENGKLNSPPTASGNGLYLGSTYLGYYSQSAWRTYMDDQGDFALAGANPNAGFLAWSSKLQRLQVQGDINIQGGNAATTSSVTTAVNNGTASLSSSLAPNIFTSTTGLINRPPSVLVGSTSGLYLGSSNLGYYDGSDWKTYMANNGNFYLSGPGTNSLSWVNGALTINGVINITGGNAATQTYASGTAYTQATTAQSNAVSTAANDATTKANSARTAAELFATGIGNNAVLSGSAAATAAQTAAINQAKADASASVNLLANGNWTAGSGTFITSNSISSPIIAGNGGYISGLFVVGNGGAITLDGSNKKMFIGAGTYANTNTSFYVDNSGQFSLKDKLTWDGTTLSITGTVVITGGATKTAIDNAAAAASTAQTTADSKITGAQVNSNVTSISGGVIQTNTINATQISALSFYGKTARFDTGDVGGWIMDGTGLYKTTGAYTLRLGANAQRISITQTAANNIDTIDRVRIEASTSIPTIAISDTGSLNWSNSGAQMGQVSGLSSPYYQSITTNYVLADGGSNQYGTGVFGIIGLQYAEEEIFVEAENFPLIGQTITGGTGGFDVDDYAYGYWNCSIRVRKFPSSTDALNQTNADTTFGINGVNEQLLAYREFRQANGSQAEFNIDKEQVYGATIPVLGGGGINTPGIAVWYRVEILQNWYIEASGGDIDTQVTAFRPFGDIFVKFGRVNNGYSVFSPGGLQVYQGVRNYMNASIPQGTSGDSSNFFIVKGKSQIIGSLNINGGFSANNKQFKIEHPLNENKWLYHTSTEAPRADLIYRGVLQLQNGEGSASIDGASNMTKGTFDALTKNPQLFLQNNESFDRIKGYVESGSVYVLSENENSTASIDWSVIAERNDVEMIQSPLYDTNGNYKTENYKGEYLDATRSERLLNYSSSI